MGMFWVNGNPSHGCGRLRIEQVSGLERTGSIENHGPDSGGSGGNGGDELDTDDIDDGGDD